MTDVIQHSQLDGAGEGGPGGERLQQAITQGASRSPAGAPGTELELAQLPLLLAARWWRISFRTCWGLPDTRPRPHEVEVWLEGGAAHGVVLIPDHSTNIEGDPWHPHHGLALRVCSLR